MPTLPSIHHITAITADAQTNVDFYCGVLGLHLVKLTVNFDDPTAYHLYYGDRTGSPGTIMTFFAWPGSPRGRVGAGQVVATAFAVPRTALPWWAERLTGIAVQHSERFGDPVLAFADPDNMPLELVGVAADPRPGWVDGPIPAAYAVRGFQSATLVTRVPSASVHLLTEVMGLRVVGSEGNRQRFAAPGDRAGNLVDVLVGQSLPPARTAAGTVHHIAWSTPDDDAQQAWHALLSAQGLAVTPVQERQYFRSIYYREPGGVLYEIATDPPGFTIDEPVDHLGSTLKLPVWLEPRRVQIERDLPPLRLPART